MKQLGNLAIVCARRKDVTLRIEQGRVMVLLDGPYAPTAFSADWDGRYIDEHFYCNECSYECAVCKEKFIGMPRIGIARSGEQRGICPACYEQVVGVCRNCTIHGDCLSIGANRFCPNQMSGLAA